MSSNFKKVVIFVLSILVLMTILFKPSYRPNIDKSGTFDINSKKAFGFYGFKTLLEQMKGKAAVYLPSDSITFADLKGKNGVSAIILGKSTSIDSSRLNDVDTFLKAGNTLVVMSENLYFFEGQNVEGETAQKDTSITEIIDTSSHHLSNDTFFIALKKQLNSITPLKCKKVNLGASEFVLDSTISEIINQGFTAPYIKNDFVSNLHCDSAFVSMSFSAYSGKVVFYLAPKLFSNYFINEKWYSKNTSFIFDQLAEGEIYILNNFSDQRSEREKYLLSEILNKPSLKYAYYLTMVMVVLSIILNFKRKYNPTEMIVKKKNLSMHYAKSLSSLFFINSDYYNMIIKIKNNFYHFVHKYYYLLPSDPDLVKNLAKRTGSSENLIESIIQLCEVSREQKPSEQHFNELYQKVEKFKKISSSWK